MPGRHILEDVILVRGFLAEQAHNSDNGHEPLHCLRVVVREEQALPAVERLKPCHFLRCKREVEDVKIFPHPILVDGLGDDHHQNLDQQRRIRKGTRLY